MTSGLVRVSSVIRRNSAGYASTWPSRLALLRFGRQLRLTQGVERLAVDASAGVDTISILELPNGLLGLGAKDAVDRAGVDSLLLQRLLNRSNAFRCQGRHCVHIQVFGARSVQDRYDGKHAPGAVRDVGLTDRPRAASARAVSGGAKAGGDIRPRGVGMHRYRVIGYDAKGERLFTLRVEALTKTDARLMAIALLRRNRSGAALAARAERFIVRRNSADE